jgi:hypothetical protein
MNQKVAGSSPAERAKKIPANRSNSRRPEPSIRRPSLLGSTALQIAVGRPPSLSLLLRPGPFYVDLGSLHVLVAQDAPG